MHTSSGSSLLTTLGTTLEHSKIGIGFLKNSTSPGVQSSVCAPDHIALNGKLTGIKYMTAGKWTLDPRLRLTSLTRLRHFGKWSKNLMGLGLFGSIGKCFTIPNCLMSSNGKGANLVDTMGPHHPLTSRLPLWRGSGG